MYVAVNLFVVYAVPDILFYSILSYLDFNEITEHIENKKCKTALLTESSII